MSVRHALINFPEKGTTKNYQKCSGPLTSKKTKIVKKHTKHCDQDVPPNNGNIPNEYEHGNMEFYEHYGSNKLDRRDVVHPQNNKDEKLDQGEDVYQQSGCKVLDQGNYLYPNDTMREQSDQGNVYPHDNEETKESIDQHMMNQEEPLREDFNFLSLIEHHAETVIPKIDSLKPEFMDKLSLWSKQSGLTKELEAEIRKHLLDSITLKEKEGLHHLESLILLVADFLLQQQYHSALEVFIVENHLERAWPELTSYLMAIKMGEKPSMPRLGKNILQIILESLKISHCSILNEYVDGSESLLNCLVKAMAGKSHHVKNTQTIVTEIDANKEICKHKRSIGIQCSANNAIEDVKDLCEGLRTMRDLQDNVNKRLKRKLTRKIQSSNLLINTCKEHLIKLDTLYKTVDHKLMLSKALVKSLKCKEVYLYQAFKQLKTYHEQLQFMFKDIKLLLKEVKQRSCECQRSNIQEMTSKLNETKYNTQQYEDNGPTQNVGSNCSDKCATVNLSPGFDANPNNSAKITTCDSVTQTNLKVDCSRYEKSTSEKHLRSNWPLNKVKRCSNECQQSIHERTSKRNGTDYNTQQYEDNELTQNLVSDSSEEHSANLSLGLGVGSINSSRTSATKIIYGSVAPTRIIIDDSWCKKTTSRQNLGSNDWLLNKVKRCSNECQQSIHERTSKRNGTDYNTQQYEDNELTQNLVSDSSEEHSANLSLGLGVGSINSSRTSATKIIYGSVAPTRIIIDDSWCKKTTSRQNLGSNDGCCENGLMQYDSHIHNLSNMQFSVIESLDNEESLSGMGHINDCNYAQTTSTWKQNINQNYMIRDNTDCLDEGEKYERGINELNEKELIGTDTKDSYNKISKIYQNDRNLQSKHSQARKKKKITFEDEQLNVDKTFSGVRAHDSGYCLRQNESPSALSHFTFQDERYMAQSHIKPGYNTKNKVTQFTHYDENIKNVSTQVDFVPKLPAEDRHSTTDLNPITARIILEKNSREEVLTRDTNRPYHVTSAHDNTDYFSDVSSMPKVMPTTSNKQNLVSYTNSFDSPKKEKNIILSKTYKSASQNTEHCPNIRERVYTSGTCRSCLKNKLISRLKKSQTVCNPAVKIAPIEPAIMKMSTEEVNVNESSKEKKIVKNTEDQPEKKKWSKEKKKGRQDNRIISFKST